MAFHSTVRRPGREFGSRSPLPGVRRSSMLLVTMVDETIVLRRAEAPLSARTAYWGRGPENSEAGIRFDRTELKRILNIYGRMVVAGEWRDYAIDFRADAAVFSVFRRASEMPLYSIEKRPRLKDRQGQYSVIAPGGQVLKRGHDLLSVLRVLERKLLKPVHADD